MTGGGGRIDGGSIVARGVIGLYFKKVAADPNLIAAAQGRRLAERERLILNDDGIGAPDVLDDISRAGC